MISFYKKYKNNQAGFTMVELLAYLFITSLLLLLIISLVINIFNARRQFTAAEIVERNARYAMGFVLNKIHNVDVIDDLGGGASNVYFYDLPDRRFSFAIENNNLVYREVVASGTVFPDQSTAIPQILNNNNVVISDLTLTPLDDNAGKSNQGVVIGFTITTGNIETKSSYNQQHFNTFMSIR